MTGSISYSPAEGNWTNGNVIAAISFNKTDVFLDNTASTGYIFSGEGTNDFTFLFHDKWGNTGSQIATVWWIDKTIPTCTLLPSLSTPTNQDVLLTLTGCSETGVQADFWSLNLPDNASGVFKYRDKANNTGTTSYDVTWIDKIPVIGSVSYSTTGFTNQDVVATMSFNKSGVSITSGYLSSLSGNVERTGQSSVIFHDNASFTLEFVDLAGNTGSQEMIVNRIDKDPVTGTIAYDITGFTNQDVTAMISFNKTDVTITNTCGMRGITNPCATTAAEFVFTQTGTFTFFFYDKYGNTGSVTATVDRIDKMPVMGTLIYTPDSTISTSGTVEATLTTNKNLLSLSGWVGSGNVWTKEFYLNTGTSISFVDVYGNAGSINVSIYWIDKVAPTIPQLGVNTQSPYAINQPQLTFSSTDNVQLSHCSLTYLEDNGNAGTTGVITVVSPVISPFNPVLDPDEQTHTLTVTCYDTAGNSSSNSITFPPVVLFTLPHPVSNTNIEDATVTIISAEGGQITNITLTGTIPNAYLSNCMGSGADTVSPYASPVTCEIHGINQGGTITVSAEDYTIHAIGTNSASFTIDTTPSEGVIVAPTLLSAGDITDTRIQIFDAVEVSVAGISIAPTTTSGMYDNFSCTQFSTSVVMCTITIKQS
ncbi:hypothetical protein FACS1894176_01310 [Bacteroidia bacterium]|nr:hypothetical protein FACS1894176_01310 [Bacteroidia bacterium]